MGSGRAQVLAQVCVSLPCRSRTRSSLQEYSKVQWEKASSISSREQQGATSSPELLLYFLNSPLMFFSMVPHWPVERQRSSPTSRKLGREQQLLAVCRPPQDTLGGHTWGTHLGAGCMSLGFTWLKTCISSWAALCCWTSFRQGSRAG